MSKLVAVPTGETARRIADDLCRRLDQERGKRGMACVVRDMVVAAAAEAEYHDEIGTEKFIGWLRALGILYRVPGLSRYGLRSDWKEKLVTADWETAPGKWGSTRPEHQPVQQERPKRVWRGLAAFNKKKPGPEPNIRWVEVTYDKETDEAISARISVSIMLRGKPAGTDLLLTRSGWYVQDILSKWLPQWEKDFGLPQRGPKPTPQEAIEDYRERARQILELVRQKGTYADWVSEGFEWLLGEWEWPCRRFPTQKDLGIAEG